MTSLRVTRRTCMYPWVDFVSVFCGFGKLVDKCFIMNNALLLIDHFAKSYGIMMLYLLLKTVELNSRG